LNMKNLFTLLAFLGGSYYAGAQTFWTEDFGTGCSQGTVASSYTGTNGTWSISNTGTNDNYANQWFVSATEAGMGVSNCGDGCLGTPSLNNRTLHVGNVSIPNILAADNGAAYFSGGLCQSFQYCATTNRRAESPTINCTGRTNITISFLYMENGSGTLDNATALYYDGNTWALLFDLAKTPTTCAPQGQWTAYSVQLPVSANNNANVKIGFEWTNNDDGAGTDPSFAVDDITLSTPVGITEVNPFNITVYSAGHTIVIQAEKNEFESIEVLNVLGSQVKFVRQGNVLQLTEVKAGVYFVRVKINGTVVTRKVFLD
jgi:hypothetical protein